MALVIEDDTGRADAEAYVDMTWFRTYWAGRGVDTSDYADADVEAALRIGAQYIDTALGRFIAQVLTNTQALEFPRANLNDASGRVTSAVPLRVKKANAEAALIQVQGTSLFGIYERGGAIASESVMGVGSITYQPGADPGTLFQAVRALMFPYIIDANRPQRLQPFSGTTDAPAIFSTEINDMPGTQTSDLLGTPITDAPGT